jgi:thiol-disulfide isomerase/thioredoxin
MNRLVQLIFLACGGALLGAAIFAGPETSQAKADPLDPLVVTGEAPAFSLAGPGGKHASLPGLRGRTILLNFWATWCEPCKQELPHLAILAAALSDRPVTLVLASADKSFEPIEALAKEIEKSALESDDPEIWLQTARMLRGELPNVRSVLDESEMTARRYGTSKYPETWLIDPQGNLKIRFIGPKPWGSRNAMERIKEMIPAG